MKMLLVNIPNVAWDVAGNLASSGPNAGSRWPWRLNRLWPSTLQFAPGTFVNTFAPYPFFMGYAVSYLRDAGIDADMYDAMARRQFDPNQWTQELLTRNPEFTVFEVATPTAALVLRFAEYISTILSRTKIVLVGPHCAAYAETLLKLPWVHAVVKGEYEIPLLKTATDSTQRLFEYEHAENIDALPSGANWVPYRDLAYLHEYYEPTMQTPVTQLCISESRGCKFRCAYCAFPKTMNNRQYRQRSVDLVLQEVRDVIAEAALVRPIRSLLTDSDTFNIGRERFQAFSAGFGKIGLPWTFMGRLDVSTMEDFDLAVSNRCVGMRFGIESFQQHVLDRTNGGRLGGKQYENAKGILGRYRNLEFHFTSMRDMPGQTEADWAKDQEIFAEFRRIGEANGNRIHHQVSRCMPLPGTDLHAEMVAAGHGQLLEQSGYNGTDAETELSRAVRGLVPMTVKGK